ncbi:anthrone oxidase [Fusarium sp. NRRL 25303]|nr:anthrone oxidase [Fusarium sp. NRRL 25303]
MNAFIIANISGIAFTISFLSQNLTLSLIGIPAMLYQRPGAVTSDKEQALVLVHQWHKIYDRGHIMGPGAALMATLSFIYALQSTGNSSEAHRTLLITAAGIPVLIFPYTHVFLHRINQELFWRAGALKLSPPEPNPSGKLGTSELVRQWGYYNLGRAFIPALGGLCAAIVLCT